MRRRKTTCKTYELVEQRERKRVRVGKRKRDRERGHREKGAVGRKAKGKTKMRMVFVTPARLNDAPIIGYEKDVGTKTTNELIERLECS